MATKVIILVEQPENKPLKPIEFVKSINADISFSNAVINPASWDNIELICKDYSSGYDLMFAYNKDRNEGILYFGHFNDGVVE